MKHNPAFKQFAKDCPQHFSEDVLIHAHLRETNPVHHVKREKSTRNSHIRIKF